MKQDLRYSEYPVPPELAASVQGIWRLEGHCEQAAPHLVLPDGCICLVLNFGAPLQPASPADAASVEKGHGLLGEIRRPLRVMAQGAVDMMTAKEAGLDNAEPRTAENTTPTTFRQWCETVLHPAVVR